MGFRCVLLDLSLIELDFLLSVPLSLGRALDVESPGFTVHAPMLEVVKYLSGWDTTGRIDVITFGVLPGVACLAVYRMLFGVSVPADALERKIFHGLLGDDDICRCIDGIRCPSRRIRCRLSRLRSLRVERRGRIGHTMAGGPGLSL